VTLTLPTLTGRAPPSPAQARERGFQTQFLFAPRVLAAALALCLGGCLVSEAPLIATGEAAYPLADKVTAERVKPNGDKWEHDVDDSAYRSGPYYIMVNEDGRESELLLKRIAQNTFIAQVRTDRESYMYGLLVFEGGTIYEYDVECDEFDAAERARYGLVAKDGDDCAVTSIQGLGAAYLARVQAGGKPSGAYLLR
jgi:hypothetical protein